MGVVSLGKGLFIQLFGSCFNLLIDRCHYDYHGSIDVERVSSSGFLGEADF